MKQKNLFYLAGGAVAAFLFARWVVQKGLQRGTIMSGDAERLQGVADLYGNSTRQQAITQAAIEANWSDLQRATANQPDWWI